MAPRSATVSSQITETAEPGNVKVKHGRHLGYQEPAKNAKLNIVLKKLAKSALQKMHCCNAALAVEKLGDRAQLGCNAGPNLLPWINVYLQRWSKPPPLDYRYITWLVQTSSLGSGQSLGGALHP